MEIKLLRAGDEHVLEACAPRVFDDPIVPESVREFLADPRHHIAVAVDQGTVVGFASAVHYIHPDKKQPELWINEVAVAPEYRRRGLAKQILQTLFDKARELGCKEAWVLTEPDNVAANALYRSVGGQKHADPQVMYTFYFTGEND